MEKFSELEYKRINMSEYITSMEVYLKDFEQADSADLQLEVFKQMNDLRNHALTMSNLCYIHYTLNTKDEFYSNEMDYVDEIEPELLGVATLMYKKILNSRFKEELEEKVGSLYFRKAEFKLKTYSDEVKDLLVQENKFVSEYVKVLSSAEIKFQGETYNMEQMKPFMVSDDREIRKVANEMYFGFMNDHVEIFDRIFDDLVKVRTKIAKGLGFNNFIELGYLRMERLDYNEDMVRAYREQVIKHIVPLASKLRGRQEKRLGLHPLTYYDTNYLFKSGNPKPQGDPNWIIEQGTMMYNDLSEDTKVFFQYMVDHELMDVLAKPGKASGGYCTYLPDVKAPFIFSNFNGTDGDITVLTHEMGHAFQSYKSKHIDVPELIDPSQESAEIHSMSMEFITYPWMENFFGPDTDKFKFMHMSDGILFIPYGTLVDHFQHDIYKKPDISPKERRQMWHDLEKLYMPTNNYEGNTYLAEGGYWQKQAHIYEVPFYYIDYTLAQICAYQFYLKDLANHEQAWESYTKLCAAGGSRSFLDLLKLADLNSPFEEGTIKEIMKVFEDKLNEIDDSCF